MFNCFFISFIFISSFLFMCVYVALIKEYLYLCSNSRIFISLLNICRPRLKSNRLGDRIEYWRRSRISLKHVFDQLMINCLKHLKLWMNLNGNIDKMKFIVVSESCTKSELEFLHGMSLLMSWIIEKSQKASRKVWKTMYT
jgi:hypothetical protein